MTRKEKLQNMLRQSPEDSFLQHALAMELISEGSDTEAIALLEAILRREPSYTGSYYQLGKLLEKKEEYAAAIDWYKKGMEAATKDGDRKAYNELHSAYEELSGD
ncbi:MAG: hypothetical protein KF862_06080 [Chitinophagaceae bacterium]|nr:hypothetical protein [Chitinophagaceae bacterium]